MVTFFKKAKEILRTGKIQASKKIERIREERRLDIQAKRVAMGKVRVTRRKAFITEQVRFQRERQKEITRRRLAILRRQPIKTGGFFGRTLQPINKNIVMPKKMPKMKRKDDFDRKDIRPAMTLDEFAKDPFGGKV